MSSYGGHIEYRDGPAGTRAALVGGPDVWTVVTTEPGVRDRAERIAAVAAYLHLSAEQTAAAFAFYDHNPDEIDAWVAANARAAREAHAAFHRS